MNSKESYNALDLDELDQIVGGAAALIQNLAASLGSITALEDQKNAIRNVMVQLEKSGSGCADYDECPFWATTKIHYSQQPGSVAATATHEHLQPDEHIGY